MLGLISRGGVKMQLQKAKFFWHVCDGHKEVCYIPFDDNNEYYDFLKEYHDKGYRQIIITSELMANLMKFFVQEKNFSVYQIELMEDDEELDTELNDILQKMEMNRAYFDKLLSKIHFLSEQSSIDINRIYFKGRVQRIAVRFFIQANGIIGITHQSYNDIANQIKKYLARELF